MNALPLGEYTKAQFSVAVDGREITLLLDVSEHADPECLITLDASVDGMSLGGITVNGGKHTGIDGKTLLKIPHTVSRQVGMVSYDQGKTWERVLDTDKAKLRNAKQSDVLTRAEALPWSGVLTGTLRASKPVTTSVDVTWL